MSKTRQDFWQWMYNCPVNHKIENDGGLEMTLTFFFEGEADSTMIGITKDLETKDEILDIINSIGKNLQDGDIWRWELIKILARHREGHLLSKTARMAIIDLANYHYTHSQAMEEFQSDYEKEKDND